MLLDDERVWLALGFAMLVYFLYYIWHRIFSRQGLPKSIPWAGEGSGAFARGKAALKSLLGMRELTINGYLKYSLHHKPFVLPNVITGHVVVLPPSQFRWLLDQPDTVLSQHEVNSEFLRADYTMLSNHVFGESRLSNFIHRQVTRDLDIHCPALVDEIGVALDRYLGDEENTEWREIRVYDVMLQIVRRLVNRVLVGLPLCRDEEYLNASTGFASTIVLTAAAINLLPSLLQPLVAPLLTVWDKKHFRTLSRLVQPLVQERSRIFVSATGLQKPSATSVGEEDHQPHDYIQWALRDAYRHEDLIERSPEMITKRLAVLGWAGIHSSAITIANALVDIAASKATMSIQDALRAEARSAEEGTHGGPWTRSALAALRKTDSTLRESLRLWGIINHGVTKAVVAPGGVTLPSGEHLRYGSKAAIASYGPHHDPSVYRDPYAFDPFRFCGDKTDPSTVGEEGNPKSVVTTGDYYMAFSHGRHACPGRFFAAQQLKLLLAHIMLRYEIDPIPARPENMWLNNTVAPPLDVTIRIRRRKD